MGSSLPVDGLTPGKAQHDIRAQLSPSTDGSAGQRWVDEQMVDGQLRVGAWTDGLLNGWMDDRWTG